MTHSRCGPSAELRSASWLWSRTRRLSSPHAQRSSRICRRSPRRCPPPPPGPPFAPVRGPATAASKPNPRPRRICSVRGPKLRRYANLRPEAKTLRPRIPAPADPSSTSRNLQTLPTAHRRASGLKLGAVRQPMSTPHLRASRPNPVGASLFFRRRHKPQRPWTTVSQEPYRPHTPLVGRFLIRSSPSSIPPVPGSSHACFPPQYS
jgi:hypothetical protein